MELRRLETLLAVAEEGHFGRAAERLFLAKATVTEHVKQLEQDFGVPLLDRSPVRLTAAGHRLARHARTLLTAAEVARADVAETASAQQPGTLRVGVMGHGSAELTPATVQAFRTAHPEVDLRLVPMDFTEHVSALLEHRVDVAFVRPAPEDERVEIDVLTTERRIVVVPARWELADAPEVHLIDVLDLPFVRLPERTPRPFTDYLYFTAARGGEAPRRGDDAVTPHEVLAAAAAGRGAGSALESFQRFYPWPGTRCVPVVDAPWEHSVLVSRAGDASPEVRAFRTLAAGLARELGPGLRLTPA
ncbi:LysR family transcriptional regulator [Saccharopolyspora mangrovi]|uniref:LysR family transcriptional regulator n=1 Tax=Saccharopolyspora mangrovi TaxID=3082379 RepID=A0ABU6A613_9PSEU|nr:LysR family transcriptional regulator [Saccharopolyspora sp. S2-29]MEB3366902.1 LysR family transcriptional regulator [Saccharopolyspora sp. S2-29]